MTESEFIKHEPCPDCGSSDALAVYTDGHTFCFSCQTRTAGHGKESKQPMQNAKLFNHTLKSL